MPLPTIERIEELAKKATPGPWHAEPFSRSGDAPPMHRGRVFFLGHPTNDRTNTRDCDLRIDDARYIAAMSPDVGEALIEVARAAEEHKEDHRDDCGCTLCNALSALKARLQR